jgi:hypothetical protein
MAFDFVTTPLQNFTASLGLTDPPSAPGEWKSLTNGSFKGVTFHVAIPKVGEGHGMVSEEIASGRRLQQIKRPGVDGAGIRDFGGEPETYSAELVFFGPTYLDDFNRFKAVLKQGTAGTLILPDVKEAKRAFFESMRETADHSAANCKMVHITWLETNEAGGPVANPLRKSLDDSKSALGSALSAASSLLNNNPLIKAVRAAESGLSAARSLTNAVFALDAGVRSRILQLQANIQGTLSLVKSASDLIFADTHSSPSQFLSPSGASQDPASDKAKQIELGVDPETGQKIVDFRSADTAPQTPDPLAKAPLASEVSVNINGIRSPTGINKMGKELSDALKANRDELLAKGGAQVIDVAHGVTAAANALKDFIAQAATPEQRLVIVPREMSLLEVLFQNSITVDQLRNVHQKNPEISDPIVLPAGTVVAL